MCSVGPCPSHASFTARSSCSHLRGSYISLGTNVTIPGQNDKYSNWHHFHYSQVNWWSSFTCQRNLMAQVIGYCHINSQQGRVLMQVQARLGSEGGVGGARPSQTHMWFSPGHELLLFSISMAVIILIEKMRHIIKFRHSGIDDFLSWFLEPMLTNLTWCASHVKQFLC